MTTPTEAEVERGALIRDLAELIAGLQVPYSISRSLLGAAADPGQRVFSRLNSFGWTDADAIEEQLLLRLGKESK